MKVGKSQELIGVQRPSLVKETFQVELEVKDTLTLGSCVKLSRIEHRRPSTLHTLFSDPSNSSAVRKVYTHFTD